MKKFLLIVFAGLFAALNTLSAQAPLLERVSVTPTRVILYWNNPPAKYSTQISPDKKKIIVSVPNANAAEAARTVHGKGVIQDVFALRSGKNLDINILLQEKRGYTVAKGSFSKSQVIDFFIWEKISPVEDNYRSGLLALENGIEETAKKYFLKAEQKGNGDAAAQLGFIELKAGNPAEAIRLFRKAVSQQTTIHDVYAGLSQAYRLEGDEAKAAQFEKIFLQRTGVAQVNAAELPKEKISTDSVGEPQSLLSQLDSEDIPPVDTLAVDSAKAAQQDSTPAQTAKTDTAKPEIIAQAPVKKDTSEEGFPSWVRNLAIGGILAFLGVVILLGWLYKRWLANIEARKAPAPAVPVPPPAASAQSPAPPSAPPAPVENQGFAGMLAHAANAYKQQEAPQPARKPETPKESDENLDFDEGDMSFAPEDPTEEKRQMHWLDEIEMDDQNPAEEEIPEKQENSQLSGQAELMMRLQEQHRLQKNQTINSLKGHALPDDPHSLNEQAKKLGVERGSIETKKNLHHIETDQAKLEELRRKFGDKPGQ